MSPTDPPPSPDPRPVEPIFPFAQAHAAVAAIEGLMDALTSVSTQQDAYAEGLFTPAFSGTFRTSLRVRHTEARDGLFDLSRGPSSRLAADLVLLRKQIYTAQDRHDEWVTAVSQWQARQPQPVPGAA